MGFFTFFSFLPLTFSPSLKVAFTDPKWFTCHWLLLLSEGQ
jgi:hypothetical protein